MGDEESAAMPSPELAKEATIDDRTAVMKMKRALNSIFEGFCEGICEKLALIEKPGPITATISLEVRERPIVVEQSHPTRSFKPSKPPPLYTMATLDDVRARAEACPIESPIADLMADRFEDVSGQTWRPIVGPPSPDEPHVMVEGSATTSTKQKVAFFEQDQVHEFYQNEAPSGVAGPSSNGTSKHVSDQDAETAAGEDVPQTLVRSKRKRDQHGPVQPVKKSRRRNAPSPFYTALPYRQPVPAPGSWYEHMVPRTEADWELFED